MLKIFQKQSVIDDESIARASHVLFIMPHDGSLAGAPASDVLRARLKRRHLKFSELIKSPVSGDLPHGGLAVWVVVDVAASAFERHTLLRRALQRLLKEQPRELVIAVFGSETARRLAAEAAMYSLFVNSALLPLRKQRDARRPLHRAILHGYYDVDDFAAARSVAQGNLLARELTMLPPNELTPAIYRQRVRQLAATEGWSCTEYDTKKLRKLGAGAFLAVAQGSVDEDAAIIHLRYRPQRAGMAVTLVGKGICFDTGGHNLKPARYMHGMHEDMNGSAVSLGIMLAASRAQLPVNLDCWLALAQNHIGPRAYQQGDVVRAVNGTTIEIVHTDAEGRLVLADTLALAAKVSTDLLIDFATLTGSMATALGARYSGVFSNRDKWLARALAAGQVSGERVCGFPLDVDYEEALDSKIADIKQCTLDGDADHILAARFLLRFVGKIPWIHMDLSASRCDGGLGAVGSDVTGFGVGWGMELLRERLLAINR